MAPDSIRVIDKDFTPFIDSQKIQGCIEILAGKIRKDVGDKDPLFLVVLNGAFIFAADLLRQFDFPLEVSFIKLASYTGTKTSGTVREIVGLDRDISGRVVIVVEDIIDSGITMDYLTGLLLELGAADVRIATLLFKPKAFKKSFAIDYVGMEIPNDFIVGCGLDYNGYGRNYPDIYKISE